MLPRPSQRPDLAERAAEQLAGYGLIEPMVFETIVAKTYRLIGSDPFWVARIYASLFWLIGGLALYFMTSAMTNPDGGILALAYYLFLPFGIIASRSFQPDPLMVMFILLGLWAFTAGTASFLDLGHHRRAADRFGDVYQGGGRLLAIISDCRAAALSGLEEQAARPAGLGHRGLSAIRCSPTTLRRIHPGDPEPVREALLPGDVAEPWLYVRWFDWTSGLVGFVAIFIALIGAALFET
jgi:hypothetical protein